MSTTTVHQQIAERLKEMFLTDLHEETWRGIEPEIADTSAFLRLDEDMTIFGFLGNDGIAYEIMLSEENIDGLLSGDQDSIEMVDGCVYQAMCDMEDEYVQNVDADDEFSEELNFDDGISRF